MSYSSTALGLSPAAYFRHGEASGTTMVDSSGNSRNGTYTGVTLGATGLLVGDTDKAADFPGSASRATVADAAWIDSTAFSVVAIVQADTLTGRRGVITRDGTSASRGWNFYLNAGKPELFDNGSSRVISTTVLATGTTYHIAMTSDGTTVKIYVNGTLDTTWTYSINNSLTNALMIGASQAGGTTPAFLFDGRIDESLYFTTALSGTDVADLYAAATGTGGGTAASGAASLAISASGVGAGVAVGTASLSLSASGAASAPVVGSASLTLSASGEGLGPGQAAGDATLTLTASGTAGADVVGAASLSVSASGAAGATAGGSASLALSASGAMGPPPPPYVAAVLADAPVGYWRLGEASGDTALDSSGHGNDGAFTYQVSTDVVHGVTGAIAGDPDTATRFLTAHDSPTASMSAPPTATPEFTYEAWVDGRTVIQWPPIPAAGMQSAAAVSVDIHADGIQVDISDGSHWQGSVEIPAVYSLFHALGVGWHHVVVTRAADGTLSLYLDGSLLYAFTGTVVPKAASESFQISPGTAASGNTTIDDPAVYDYALPADRVAAHYLIGHGASGTASLSLTASGTVTGASSRGTATLTLSALGQVPTPTAGLATLELFAEGWASEIFATDTSNALDGLDLLLSASVQQFTPVAAAPAGLAERYDVAIPYPTPVMSGGRPT